MVATLKNPVFAISSFSTKTFKTLIYTALLYEQSF